MPTGTYLPDQIYHQLLNSLTFKLPDNYFKLDLFGPLLDYTIPTVPLTISYHQFQFL